MEISFKIPDELALQLAAEGQDPARAAIEALALEGYRAGRLSESAVRELLGFETRMEVHAFLNLHGVCLNYDLADLEQDIATADKLSKRFRNEKASSPTTSE